MKRPSIYTTPNRLHGQPGYMLWGKLLVMLRAAESIGEKTRTQISPVSRFAGSKDNNKLAMHNSHSQHRSIFLCCTFMWTAVFFGAVLHTSPFDR